MDNDQHSKFMRATAEYEDRKKSTGVMYALWFFLGVLGAHRFYLGNTGYAVGMLLTAGGVGVWTLVDVFFIGKRLVLVNQQIRAEVFERHGLAA